MKNYARKHSTRGKVAYRTPSRFRAETARVVMRARNKKGTGLKALPLDLSPRW